MRFCEGSFGAACALVVLVNSFMNCFEFKRNFFRFFKLPLETTQTNDGTQSDDFFVTSYTWTGCNDETDVSFESSWKCQDKEGAGNRKICEMTLFLNAKRDERNTFFLCSGSKCFFHAIVESASLFLKSDEVDRHLPVKWLFIFEYQNNSKHTLTHTTAQTRSMERHALAKNAFDFVWIHAIRLEECEFE